MEMRTQGLSFSPVQGGLLWTPVDPWMPQAAGRLSVIGMTPQIPLPSETHPCLQPPSCGTRTLISSARSIIAREGTSDALPTQSLRRTQKTSPSSGTVRAGGVSPGQGVPTTNRLEGCPNLDPLILPGSADFNWVIESPTGTEIRLLEHTESPVQDPQASEESLAGTSQPGEGTGPQGLALGQLPSPQPPFFAYQGRSQQMPRAASSILVCKAQVVQRGTGEAQKGREPPLAWDYPLAPCLLPDSSLPLPTLQGLPYPPKTEQSQAGVSG